MLKAELDLPIATLVFATDAMGAELEGDHGGYGVVARKVSPELALQTIAAGTRPGATT